MRCTLLVVLTLAACDSPPTPAVPSTGCETAFDTFEDGFSVTSTNGSFTVAVTADAEPDVGDNDWVLTVTDGTNPVPAASVVVEPWMPAHGHGITPPTYIGAAGDAAGVYVVPTFNLIMPGVWEFKIDISEGMVSDTAVFTFCAEG